MVSSKSFLEFAAGVLDVSANSLSLETTYGSIPEWDSMAQLRLVTEIASKYGVEIPFADVVNVTSLWEFLRRINGEAVKKVVAVDLDNTLWEGVVGEDGVDGILPNRALQRELKRLKDRGVLLVILSKNNEKDALEGLDSQPGLSRDDFVAWRINWETKAENLIAIAKELNLGADSFVFVDDNPVERLRMSAYLPQVTVAEFPPRLEAYFPERPLTDEDRRKTEEYRAEAKRKSFLTDINVKDPLNIRDALGLEVDVHQMTRDEVSRVAQLSQKANQFDVCTNRYEEEDIRRLAVDGLILTAHARDRFGDHGLVAFVIVKGNKIVDWVMSCRVMGRGIEDIVREELVRVANDSGLTKLSATWRDSGKNTPVRDLYERMGFDLVRQSKRTKQYCLSLGRKQDVYQAIVDSVKDDVRKKIDPVIPVLVSVGKGTVRVDTGKGCVVLDRTAKMFGKGSVIKGSAVKKSACIKAKSLKAAAFA